MLVIILGAQFLNYTAIFHSKMRYAGERELEASGASFLEAKLNYKNCSDIMKYQVGDYVLGISRASLYVKPQLLAPGYVRYPCDEVIKLKRLRYSPSQFMEYQDPSYQGSIVNFSISEQPKTRIANKFEDELLKRQLQLHQLPMEDGFFKLQVQTNQFFLIPRNNKPPNLKFIKCTKLDSEADYSNCALSFLWKNELSVGFSFDESEYKISDWRRLYYGAEDFLEKLLIANHPVRGKEK